MALINFDATKIEPDEGRAGPIPANWYDLAVINTEISPTKDGTGNKLTATFQVIDGPFKNRKIFHNFNIKNQSEKAQEIALKQFSALCHATNVLHCADTTQLHNIPIKGRVKVTPEVKNPDGSIQYDAKNEITAFKARNDPSVVMDTPTLETKAIISLPPIAPPSANVQSAPPAWNVPSNVQPWDTQNPNAQPVVAQTTAAQGQAATTVAPSQEVAVAPSAENQPVPPWMK